jgi:hypothetical protein
VAINAIRIRVLLDYGRDRLAQLRGYTDWADWKFNTPSKDSLHDSVYQFLKTSMDLNSNWKAIGCQPEVLKMFLQSNSVQDRGDIAAHSSTQELITDSVIAFSVTWERAAATAIFRAVYGVEPDGSF